MKEKFRDGVKMMGNMSLRILRAIMVFLVTFSVAYTKTPEERITWWQEARFGMFIHWGVYSIPERGEWLLYQEHIPFNEYKLLADQFTAKNYNPADWVALAQESGMKYMIIGTRHHDGFCLFDSKYSDFTAVKSAAGRDLITEFVAACRAAGMRIGFYYSLINWHFPGILPRRPDIPDSVLQPIVEQAHQQVRELCTNYGKIDILWYDGMWPNDINRWRTRELEQMVRTLQPDIIINDRAGLPGDFATPENTVSPSTRPWESCYSMNRTWGYARYDRNYKTPHELIRLLAACVDGNGNFLLNVAPRADGKIPVEMIENLRYIGQWLKVNGEAIYGAGSSPIITPNLGLNTSKGDKVYLLIQRWPGATIPIGWCGSKVKSATLLFNGQKARIEQQGDRVWLRDLPAYPPDPFMPVIELEFYGQPEPTVPPYR